MNANQWKQSVIDGYLNDTGRNLFVPKEFIEWLGERPDHQAYPIFFGKDDAEAALAYRIDLARRWVSGLRITVVRGEPRQVNVGTLTVAEYRLPAAHSPVLLRRGGGGYVATDPRDPDHMREIGRQAAAALQSWLDRYAGAAAVLGVDVSSVRETVKALDGAAAEESAA